MTFAEKKLGLSRTQFKATVCSHSTEEHDKLKQKWARILEIPTINFTNVSADSRINRDNVQIYFNSVVLVELLKSMHEKLKPIITSNADFATAYMKGIFAGEGCVLLRSGTLFHVDIATKDEACVRFYKQCLDSFGITHGKYMRRSLKFPIYGYKNFERFRELNLHALHPDKREKFERGFASYKRINVLDGEEARTLILQQLASGPKTYDDLAAALGKARTTVQAHHIPILEREGRIIRAGKRGQSWLWVLTQPNQIPTHDTILKITIMAT